MLHAPTALSPHIRLPVPIAKGSRAGLNVFLNRKVVCPSREEANLSLFQEWRTFLRASAPIFYIVYTTTHCSLKAYCAILVRRSNFRHQASPRMSPRESTQRRKVELWARNVL